MSWPSPSRGRSAYIILMFNGGARFSVHHCSPLLLDFRNLISAANVRPWFDAHVEMAITVTITRPWFDTDVEDNHIWNMTSWQLSGSITAEFEGDSICEGAIARQNRMVNIWRRNFTLWSERNLTVDILEGDYLAMAELNGIFLSGQTYSQDGALMANISDIIDSGVFGDTCQDLSRGRKNEHYNSYWRQLENKQHLIIL